MFVVTSGLVGFAESFAKEEYDSLENALQMAAAIAESGNIREVPNGIGFFGEREMGLPFVEVKEVK